MQVDINVIKLQNTNTGHIGQLGPLGKKEIEFEITINLCKASKFDLKYTSRGSRNSSS